jgi:hypothetical protein
MNSLQNKECRYLSTLRPLGCWVNLDQEFKIENPKDTDVNPFDPTWKVHSVLVTDAPLPDEKIQSYQLTDLQKVNNQKALCDILNGMVLNVKAERTEVLIKEELGAKIQAGKIKNRTVLNKMVERYVNSCNGVF